VDPNSFFSDSHVEFLLLPFSDSDSKTNILAHDNFLNSGSYCVHMYRIPEPVKQRKVCCRKKLTFCSLSSVSLIFRNYLYFIAESGSESEHFCRIQIHPNPSDSDSQHWNAG
jgi:hypothetical protein